jgi:hypothetical protein
MFLRRNIVIHGHVEAQPSRGAMRIIKHADVCLDPAIPALLWYFL